MSFIEFKDISKNYGDCVSCRGISLGIQKNTVHAFVGENGAGKSTLMNILGGLTPASSGKMQIAGQNYQPASALDAYSKKIAYIHQHFVLAKQLTAFENILLSCSAHLKSYKKIPESEILNKTNVLLQKFNWTVQLDKQVHELSVGEQQRIEILKALLIEPDMFIFDEPTAVLSPQESHDLLDFILKLKSEGKTILLISHKLNEIKKVADTITVLRQGQLILTKPCIDLSIDAIAETMIGRKPASKKVHTESGSKNNFMLLPNSKIQVYKSEIFGIAGIEGNGQTALIENLINQFKTLKINYGDITEDRLPLSVFTNLNLVDHVILKHKNKISKRGFIHFAAAKKMTLEIINKWDVRPGNASQKLSELSGGNQQKFIVGRELIDSPKALIAAHPTRGVDLGAQELIHDSLRDYTKNNNTVFLISADLEEVINVSDRYVIIYKNQFHGPFKRNDLTELQMGQYMTGIHI